MSLYSASVLQTTTNSRHTQASYESTTRFCWKRWTSNRREFSMNLSRERLSDQTKRKTSTPRRRRSEQTRNYCQCSVASLPNNFNSFSVHWTSVDSNMSAMLSTAHSQVCPYFIARYMHKNCSTSLSFCIPIVVTVFSVYGRPTYVESILFQGRSQDFTWGTQMLSAEGARIEAPKAPRRVRIREVVSPYPTD